MLFFFLMFKDLNKTKKFKKNKQINKIGGSRKEIIKRITRLEAEEEETNKEEKKNKKQKQNIVKTPGDPTTIQQLKSELQKRGLRMSIIIKNLSFFFCFNN
jgi:hypothetical protein